MDDHGAGRGGDVQRLAEALDALPVFPLPGIVLFPGALLPLHIFEPRYRAMLADCMESHRCMAMAYALGGDDRSPADPRIARVAGAGIVVHHAALPTGRSNIVLRGLARVVLEELPFTPPYRRARARVLADVDTPVTAVDRMALHGAAAAFAAASREMDFALPAGLAAGAAADFCAHRLIVDPPTRQRVLEELDVRARVRMVTATLAELVGRKERRSGRPD